MSNPFATLVVFFRQHIGTRIMAGFGLITLLALLVALVSLANVTTVNRRLEESTRRDRQAVAHVLNMQLAVEQQAGGVSAYLLSDDEARGAKYLAEFNAGAELFQRSIDALEQEIDQPAASERLARLRDLESRFREVAGQQIALRHQGWRQSAVYLWGRSGQERQDALVTAIREFAAWQEGVIGQEMETARARSLLATAVALGLVGLAGLISTMIALVLTRSITRPIRALARIADVMKSGNLDVSVPPMGSDEIGTLAQTIDQMARALKVSRRSLEASLAETEQRNRELLALNTIAAAASTLDRQALLLKVLDTLLELTGDEAAGIVLRDPGGRLLPTAQRGLPESLRTPEAMDRIARDLDAMMLRPGLTSLVLDDQSEQPAELLALFRAAGFRSLALVPLATQSAVVGVLGLVSRRGRPFEAAEMALLINIGNQIGVAVENASLLSQLERRVTTLSIINEVSRAISAVLDLDRLYTVIYEQVRRALDMPTFTIGLWDEERDEFVPGVVYLDNERQDLTQGWPTRPALALMVARTGRSILTNDYYATAHELGFTDIVPPEPYIRRSWMGVPMTIGDRLVGVIVVATPNRLFTDEDHDLLVAIANQAAVAVENAHLYRRTRELGVIEERNRLAREIHDTIAQGLTGIVLQLEATGTLLDMKPDRARQRLTKATELARSTLAEARRSVWNLRPQPLEERSLYDAIAGEARKLEDEAIEVRCEQVGELIRPAPETENAVYRIAQEALQNIRKHARATLVEVTLAFAPEQLTLTIRDNGRGFDPERLLRQRTDGGGFGMLGMRERARLVGGQLAVQSTAGAGTVLVVSAPLAGHAGIPKPTQPASPTATRALLP
jgi:signal transduction histidine kinase/CHASE3 domain sensor protein